MKNIKMKKMRACVVTNSGNAAQSQLYRLPYMMDIMTPYLHSNVTGRNITLSIIFVKLSYTLVFIWDVVLNILDS